MPLVIAAFVIIAIIAVIYNAIQAQKRREGLFELSQRLNLSFDPEKDYSVSDRFNFLKELNQGENRYATNVLSGTYQGNKVLAFDYHYATVTHDDKGAHTEDHWFSFFIVTIPTVFPQLTIRREGLFTKIAEAFGYQNIKFESAEFSKTFCVRSADKKFAYDFCNAKMIEYLLSNRDLNIETENEVIALVFSGRISLEAFEPNLQRLAEIRSRLPQYLFTQNA